MPNEEVAPERPRFPRDDFDEVLFDFDRIGVFGQSKAFAQARDMRVHHKTRLDAVGVAEDDVGGLASDARKMGEGFEVLGNFTVVFLHK